MRIAVVTSGYLPVPPTLGGAVETLIQFYLEENEKTGEHQFTVYSIYQEDAAKECRIYKQSTFKFFHGNSFYYRLKKKLYQQIHKTLFYDHHTEFYLHNVIQDLRKYIFDVIIVENKPGFVLPLSEATKAKIVLHLHNDHLNAATPYAKMILKRCYKIITVSEYIKKRVATISDSNKIVTVHNGIDLNIFHNAHPVNRTSLGLTTDDFVLVFSGRLNADKGIKELLEAILLLKDKPNIKLLVLGGSGFGNETENNEFIYSLKQIAQPLKDKIIFTGFIPYKTIPSYLKLADVAIIPSMWEEAFGLTVIEAMSVGLPIIATKSGGIPEITNKDCCVLIDKKDVVQQIQIAVLMLLSDRNKLIAMGKNAKENSALYSKERYARDFLLSTI